MVVRDAARATLAAGTARVWRVRFLEGSDTAHSREEGETDFARRRTRTTIEHTLPDEWRQLGERIVERWPWLADEDVDEEPAGPVQMLYAGSASWNVMPDAQISGLGGGDAHDLRRGHTDPTWIIEVLGHAHREDRRGERRYRFCTDLRETGEALAIPPNSWARTPRIAGEAWLDEAGRIRRVTWCQAGRRRGQQAGPREWSCTELWDYGLPVDIPLPEPRRDPPLPVMVVAFWWQIRQRRRAYERRAG
jgi:hypothetical protein